MMAMAMTAAKTKLRDWETLAEAGDLEGAVLAFVARRDWVSFAELKRWFASYYPDAPSAAVLLPGNLVLWADLPLPLAKAVAGLLRSGKVYVWPVSYWVYLADGLYLALPIVAPSPRGGGWRWRPSPEARWLPAALRLARPISAAAQRMMKEVRVA